MLRAGAWNDGRRRLEPRRRPRPPGWVAATGGHRGDAAKVAVAMVLAAILVGFALWFFLVRRKPPPSPPGPGRPPVARFMATQGRASTVELTSTSTSAAKDGLECSWVIDSGESFDGCRVTRSVPIGEHKVSLTVTDSVGRTARSARTIGPVIWRGTPYEAQKDASNPGHRLPTHRFGPYRFVACVNNGYSLVNRPDGVGAFTVHQGDHPLRSGGDRCALTLNEAYTPYINPAGVRPQEPRFYRLDVGVPKDWPAQRLAGYETFVEWHGVSPGPSLMTIGVSGDNRRLRFQYAPVVNGVPGPRETFDDHPLAPGTFHSYIIEMLQSADPEVGYFRIWRDGRCRTCGDPRADGDGKVRRRTQKIVNGEGEIETLGIQNYRSREITVPTTVLHRNTMIGPTFDSVAGDPPERLDRGR